MERTSTNKALLGFAQLQLKRTFARTTPQPQPPQKRAPRPLTRTQSINSGSTLLDETNNAIASTKPAVQDGLSKSLVGSNVHGTYNAQRERSLWLRRPL